MEGVSDKGDNEQNEKKTRAVAAQRGALCWDARAGSRRGGSAFNAHLLPISLTSSGVRSRVACWAASRPFFVFFLGFFRG